MTIIIAGYCLIILAIHMIKLSAHTHTLPYLLPVQDSKVYLQVHNAALRWLDPDTSSPTLTQPINKIRVWGIGLDNERDFGYVARDIDTKKHKCHVFRCERPARAIARALLEAHQRDRQERRARKATKKEESVATKEPAKGELFDHHLLL